MKTESKNIVVEIPLPDGCLSMYAGRLAKRDADRIDLVDAAWIACTGRRHLFFRGEFDPSVEIEPYPDGVVISLPAAGAIVTSWPHALPREAR